MKWAIIGAGAQGMIVLDVLREQHRDADLLFVDDDDRRVGNRLHDVEVVSRQTFLQHSNPESFQVMVAIGHNEVRLRIAAELAACGARFGNVVHPSAIVLASATLADGIMLCPGAIVGSAATVGRHALINTGAIVEHDCIIEEGVSLSPGVRMAGRVRIGRAAFIGTGATLNPRITIGERAIVGSGALVTRDVRPGMLVFGVPAREVRPVDSERDWAKLL
jgi:acetyltransferase EpsM